jgi:integrase
MAGRLTVAEVRAAKTKGKLYDGHGLILNVVGPDQRYWMFRFKRAGRDRTMSLGNADVIGLAEARSLHAEARRKLASGADPLEAREQAKAAQTPCRTFLQAAEAYLAAHRAGWRNRVEAIWRSSLVMHVFPTFGQKPVSEVDREDVLAALTPIWTKKPVTASIVRNRIELIFDYAIARNWREKANPAQWRSGLKALLPAVTKVHTTVHRAALPWQQAPSFMATLTDQDGMAARCLAFAILTATRSGEARGALWSEVDLDAAVWTIPAARMKAKKPHTVPLSEPAITILRELHEVRTGDVIFFGRAGVIADTTLRDLLQQVHPGITVHGFRSSFRDWAADTGKPGDLAEQCLAHTVGSAVERAYRRSDVLERRRALMDAWAAYLTAPPAVVLPFQAAG